jgi:hypothetical protein
MMRRLHMQVIKVTDVWKAIRTAELLIDNYIVRVESYSNRFSKNAQVN